MQHQSKSKTDLDFWFKIWSQILYILQTEHIQQGH